MPYVDSKGVPIYYEVVGNGFPIVLHTGGGGDGRMWREGGYLAGLDGFQVILLDHRGHGQSGKPGDIEAHRMECYVDDVIAVLNAEGIDRAVFWGYSAGASVGLALASAHPDRISGLVTLGGVGDCDFDNPEDQQWAEETATAVREAGVGGFVEGAFASEGIEVPEWFVQQMRSTDAEMFALAVLGSTSWHGPWSVFDRIECPVLLLAGEMEDPDGDNARAAGVLRDARSVTLPGLGHIGAYVRSDLSLSEAIPFLREVVQRERRG